MSLLFRLLSVRLHLGEQFFFRGALVGWLFAAKCIVFLMARLTFGAFGRAGGFVVHDEAPFVKGAFS